ncbi:7821_t:CDS:2, partial [Scutellospora calospora]
SEITTMVPIQTEYLNTFCLKCGKICHEKCNGWLLFCCINWFGQCTICKCHYLNHARSYFKMEQQIRKVSKIINDAQAEYLHEKKASYDKIVDEKRNELEVLNMTVFACRQ